MDFFPAHSNMLPKRDCRVVVILMILQITAFLPGFVYGAAIGDPRAFYRRPPPALTNTHANRPIAPVDSADVVPEISPLFLRAPTNSWFFPDLNSAWKPRESRMDADIINRPTDNINFGINPSHLHSQYRPQPRTATAGMFAKPARTFRSDTNYSDVALNFPPPEVEYPYDFFRMSFF
ncbi:uncharacterized protein LOC129597127 isoform X2 [Paramacrobiotus metropolitanus]|uniref:uncharacterized protein LOC129597127 isoform X2 n=1 Tax=Paramacrobiotus metropolitanus TaxID=2943436 RepID=UPI002445A027|nr:uncharacterized protein LOC129597127 isoform X2 [Paramacrobiotus metropolitanus]